MALAALCAAALFLPAAPAAADDPSPVKINEVESNGGTPGDWVELVNTGATGADVSGWVFKDNDDTHVFTVAAGSTIAPGAFLVLDVDAVFGLGSADSARLYLADGTTLVDMHSWTAHAATTYGRCLSGTGAFTTTTSSTRGAANDCGTPVRINEVESNGGTPGDWVELVNTGASTVDVSGWVVKDSDDTHAYAIPAGTTIAAGAFLAVDVEVSYGLGGADSARLFQADGTTLVDAYSWTAHAATTYGRCPDGTGAFAATTAPTRGAGNACPGQTPATPWPGDAAVADADAANVFGTNMSGLAYQGGGVLWAVKNGPGTLYRLVRAGATWIPDPAGGWAAGKPLHYADGTGDLDAEGVTLTAAGPAGGVYVATERDNADSGVSRPRIVRFDPAATGTSLNATVTWNIGADLPPVAANSGIEGITWIPDAHLTARGLHDEHRNAPYDPAAYPGHGDGLFLVGLEANGQVYAYALDHTTGGFTRVATVASGFPAVMDLVFEPETGHLWAVCDDTCQGRTATLDIDAQGRFAVTDVHERPAGMGNFNNEGFAIAPQSECVLGRKPVYWADDSNDAGHALRSGTLSCVDLDADDDGILDEADPLPTDPANDTFTDGATTGRLLSRGGRAVAVTDAANPAGVRVTTGPGTTPARVQLTGTAVITLGEGAYELTGAAATSTVTVLSGEPAVVTVTVQGTPLAVTVAPGGTLTFTEATANGTVTGLTGIGSTAATWRADGVDCGTVAVRNLVVGSTRNEWLAGTTGDDLILGKGGNDIVSGGGGSDCVITGAGNDVLTTTGGADVVDAGGGNNVVSTGDGADVVRTSAGNDVITAGEGADAVDAGNGNNVVNTAGGDDRVGAGSGNDVVDCGAGSDVANAGRGNNVNTGGRCEAYGV